MRKLSVIQWWASLCSSWRDDWNNMGITWLFRSSLLVIMVFLPALPCHWVFTEWVCVNRYIRSRLPLCQSLPPRYPSPAPSVSVIDWAGVSQCVCVNSVNLNIFSIQQKLPCQVCRVPVLINTWAGESSQFSASLFGRGISVSVLTCFSLLSLSQSLRGVFVNIMVTAHFRTAAESVRRLEWRCVQSCGLFCFCVDQTTCFVLFRLSHFGTDLSVAKGVGYAAGRSQAPLCVSGTLKEGVCVCDFCVSPDAASSGVPAAVCGGAPTRLPWPPLWVMCLVRSFGGGGGHSVCVCGGGGGNRERPYFELDLYEKNKSETGMTASLLKQDPNT